MCLCVCVCVCTCRVGQNVDSHQPVLQDDHTYSSVDDAQQQMFALSGNPAYKTVPEHSEQPLQEDDRAYSNIDISQQEEVATSGNPEHGTALGAAAGAK